MRMLPLVLLAPLAATCASRGPVAAAGTPSSASAPRDARSDVHAFEDAYLAERFRRFPEQALGPAFDVRAFHDAVLENGQLPLPLLRARIGRFVEERRASAR